MHKILKVFKILIAQSLTAIVPGQLLGSRFLEYQRRMKTKLIAAITRVNGDLKRQIKNRTFYTSRLFLLSKIFQYTSKWLKVSWAFTHPLI